MSDASECTTEELRARYARELERLGVLQREFFAAEKAHQAQCDVVRDLRKQIDERSPWCSVLSISATGPAAFPSGGPKAATEQRTSTMGLAPATTSGCDGMHAQGLHPSPKGARDVY